MYIVTGLLGLGFLCGVGYLLYTKLAPKVKDRFGL